MNRARMTFIASVALFAIVISGAVVIGIDRSAQNRKVIRQIITAQVSRCHDDRAFRKQNKIRAVAEKKLLMLFVVLSKEQLATGKQNGQTQTPEQRRVTEAFLREFAPLVHRIHILPVPDCRRLAKHLRAHLH